MRITLLITCLLVWASFRVAAQASENQPELNSDRPNFTQAAAVVPHRTVQIETGLGYKHDKSEEEHTSSYVHPTTLLRFGILKKAELRLNFDFEQENSRLITGKKLATAPQRIRGFDNVQIGAKVALVEARGVIPDVGLLASVLLPVGLKEYRPPHLAPMVELLFDSHFSDKLELQYNFGYRKHQEEGDYLVQLLYSASAIQQINDKFQVMVEFQAFKSHQQAAENSMAGGVTYKVIPNLQVDILGGLGVSELAPDYYTSAGLTWRLPR